MVDLKNVYFGYGSEKVSFRTLSPNVSHKFLLLYCNGILSRHRIVKMEVDRKDRLESVIYICVALPITSIINNVYFVAKL